MKLVRILVSNTALPSTKIGSWTTRMSYFIKRNPNFFNYILAPGKDLSVSLYCKKRSFITWKKPLRRIQLLYWVAKDYVKQLKILSKKYDKLIIVVMDDPHIVEAISLIKNRLNSEVEFIFSFHGFQLRLEPIVVTSLDRILWLSQKGLEKSRATYSSFPKSYVVGNAVNSAVFFPLEYSDFVSERVKKGYRESDEILIWMANDRPKKGIHIFKDVAEKLLQQHANLKIIIIGSTQKIHHPNVSSIGRIPNNEVANYLQIGNYYMFTTLYEEGFGLSVVEAAKCGNIVFASNRGAVSEVLKDINHSYLIDNPEAIHLWIESFNLARINNNYNRKRITKDSTVDIWNYKDWETRFQIAVDA